MAAPEKGATGALENYDQHDVQQQGREQAGPGPDPTERSNANCGGEGVGAVRCLDPDCECGEQGKEFG